MHLKLKKQISYRLKWYFNIIKYIFWKLCFVGSLKLIRSYILKGSFVYVWECYFFKKTLLYLDFYVCVWGQHFKSLVTLFFGSIGWSTIRILWPILIRINSMLLLLFGTALLLQKKKINWTIVKIFFNSGIGS